MVPNLNCRFLFSLEYSSKVANRQKTRIDIETSVRTQQKEGRIGRLLRRKMEKIEKISQ
jgi:hypothetical protein